MPDDLAEVIQDRPGWSIDGGVATYRPESSWWSAVVRRPAHPSRPSHRFSVGGIHPDGAAAWAAWAGSARDAVRMAEAWVRAQG
jgi:hypothetical protein